MAMMLANLLARIVVNVLYIVFWSAMGLNWSALVGLEILGIRFILHWAHCDGIEAPCSTRLNSVWMTCRI